MKYLKMLGLAAIAALALAAFGAGSASATVLCSTATSPCTGTKYPAGTTIEASLKTGTVATLTNSISNVTCTVATIGGKTTTAGSATETVKGEVTSFKFSECKTASGVACTVTETKTPYAAEIHYTSGSSGTLTVSKGSGGEDPGATVVCGVTINCKFTTTLASVNVNGGNPATAIASKISLLRAGGICPAEATWDAEYTVTKPNPLYIAAS